MAQLQGSPNPGAGVFILIVLFFAEITAFMVKGARMINGSRLKHHP
jgi:hypothetical protein